jgi:hypothetical protein
MYSVSPGQGVDRLHGFEQHVIYGGQAPISVSGSPALCLSRPLEIFINISSEMRGK